MAENLHEMTPVENENWEEIAPVEKEKWEEMTPAEKIENLRRDVLRLFREINVTDHSLRSLAHHLDKTTQSAKQTVAKVAALETRRDSVKKKRGK
ncbi:MAG TPA: hypothetical protein VHU15_17575 [Stellaceae bacterium]|jgi:hypothetical protein|nr:hypothetical protein [Stellaceae bacterium]